MNLKHKWTMCPRTPLPFSIGKINAGVDAYICTHAHMDHIGLGPNGKGCEGLKKNLPIYAINRRDADFLEFSGMKDVRVIEDRFTYGDAEVIKVNAVHGTIKPCCDAAGFIFRAPGEKTVYLCGDTVWCDDVKETIAKYQPDVIITNNCAAMLKANGRLIMDVDDLANVIAAAPGRSRERDRRRPERLHHRKPHGRRAARHAHAQDAREGSQKARSAREGAHPRRRRELRTVNPLFP